MKVLLVIPKRDMASILAAPDIGLAYVARQALNAGADVFVLDAHKENICPDKFKCFLKARDFDLIGIKCLSTDVFNVLEYCRVIKQYCPDTKILLGSCHPTALPHEIMKSRDVDYIIRGEAESGIFSLIKKLIKFNGKIPREEINDISGLVYRDETDDNKINFNPVTLEKDLDRIGFPAWHLFKIKEYPKLPGSGGRFLPVLTSRGCPSDCTFCCSNSIHGRAIRTRSPEHVIEEIKWLIKDFGIEKVSIFDDNFTFYKKHAMEFSKLYLKNNFPVKFDIPQGVRIDRIDKELLLALEEAGCDYMGIGIESGGQETLDIIRKGTDISLIEEKINLIKKWTRIKLMGFFIIGFPHETGTNVLRTINFAMRLKLDYAAFTIFTPFPGTALFEQMLKEGYFSLDNFNWEKLLLDRETFRHKNISRNRLKKLQRKAYLRFYFRPSKLGFFFRIIFKEASFKSYIKRFFSILKK